jgi:hypothetical protein
MSERTIFLTALEKADSAQRRAYIDQVCAGDVGLRERVEALLRSHEREGQFLDVPAVEQLGVAGAQQVSSGVTQSDASSDGDEAEPLDFLAPSDKPGVMGRLGHYEIHEVIGRGGMGIVFRAFDEKLHRVVAIKVMSAHLAASAAARKRFRREAQAAAAVSHDHIVTIHAVEETERLPYLVMQYVAGVSLQDRLDKDGPLELAEILRIGMQTASGLASAHAQGLIHRDIKPANILLENGVERVKITDFGLARAVDDASLTQSGVVAGTPLYMAPEQARGEPVDQRTDLFSLGSVLYAMCTGRAPFRASGSMAVLKRVCEETPSPIREINPAIPASLVAIIDKLQAKDPEDRFQTAAELADLLSRHLAHVQHPSVAPLPSELPHPPIGGERVRLRGSQLGAKGLLRRLAAAAIFLFPLVGLGLTEATGVTQLASTVIRIFTPGGTLVVETDDPAVKVTVEGDGGLVITGAGLEEIRLRPGNYKVQADRDGKPVPLDKSLVEVTRGGRAIVKVKVEAATVLTAAKAEKGAFVVIGGEGVQEKKFDELADAVIAACHGDTIELRGNGPFETRSIGLGEKELKLRAGQGYRPVLRFLPDEPDDPRFEILIATSARLVLEGLEIRDVGKDRRVSGYYPMIYSDGDLLALANCRLLSEEPSNRYVALVTGHIIRLKNCEFYGPMAAGSNDIPMEVEMHNCVGLGHYAIYVNHAHASTPVTVELKRNTLLASAMLNVGFSVAPDPQAAVAANKVKRLSFDATSNVFEVRTCAFLIEPLDLYRASAKWDTWEDAEKIFAPVLGLREQGNVYSPSGLSIAWRSSAGAIQPPAASGTLEWERFWELKNTGSREGQIRLNGGDLFAKMTAHGAEQITPADFRLRSDSAGYRAGPDGKDLGANVELVGPGPAYERWKKTPEYQQWLKETGQTK